MKFTGQRQTLLDAFTLVGSVVAPRLIKPVLQNVRLTVDGGGATLQTTDLEVALQSRIDLPDVKEPGEILVPVNRLIGILREVREDRVVFELEDHTLKVRCGRATFRIHGEVSDEFPTFEPFDDAKALAVDPQAFRTLIKRTAFAAAKEKTRYAFNGIRLEIDGDEMRMVATDGKRMAVKWAGIENPDGISGAVIVPTKGLATFDKVLADAHGPASLVLADQHAMIRAGDTVVTTRLLEGAFPRYDSVIPKSTPTSARFAKDELLSALRQASILTNEESRSVLMSFEEDRVVLTSRAMDVGESRLETEIELEGQPMQVAFNPDFVVEGLKGMEAETITFLLSGKDTPARLDGEENYIYIVMPVTLRSG